MSTAGNNKNTVKKYIQGQEKADISQDKQSMKEQEALFIEDKEIRKQNKK